jgi:hypothetical protein
MYQKAVPVSKRPLRETGQLFPTILPVSSPGKRALQRELQKEKRFLPGLQGKIRKKTICHVRTRKQESAVL